MARIWKYMNDNGLPTYIDDAKRLAYALRGDDYVLIMPSHTNTDYVSGEHFGKDIVTAIHLPEENRAVIIEYTEWQPVETACLSDLEHTVKSSIGQGKIWSSDVQC